MSPNGYSGLLKRLEQLERRVVRLGPFVAVLKSGDTVANAEKLAELERAQAVGRKTIVIDLRSPRERLLADPQ